MHLECTMESHTFVPRKPATKYKFFGSFSAVPPSQPLRRLDTYFRGCADVQLIWFYRSLSTFLGVPVVRQNCPHAEDWTEATSRVQYRVFALKDHLLGLVINLYLFGIFTQKRHASPDNVGRNVPYMYTSLCACNQCVVPPTCLIHFSSNLEVPTINTPSLKQQRGV